MKKLIIPFLFLAITALFITSCGDRKTYRLRTLSDKKVFLVTQSEIKGLRIKDTVQVDQNVNYPYNWEIKPGTPNLIDTLYMTSYRTGGGDTSWMTINRKIATVEEIIK